MIYAIAITDNKLAHKFSESERFHFYDDQQTLIAVYKNPALLGKGCSSKNLIVELLLKMKCDMVIVRKIGENNLARLLAAGLKVEQGNTRHSVAQLLTEAALVKNPLTKPEQGVPKKNKGCHKH